MVISKRRYGPLSVFPVAFGAGHIGEADLDEAELGRLLDRAIDAGINLFDTAPSYGASEERLGRLIAARRSEVLLSTKLGYGVPGHEDWTPGCIAVGIDRALHKLRVDHLDVAHLHSCPREVLDRGGVVEPLVAAVRAGKVRVAAYSGDNDALAWAVESGAFGAVQASFSVVDRANQPVLQRAHERGLGTLVKRGLANAVWRFEAPPSQPDHRTYWERWRALDLPDLGLPPAELALRFAATRPGVSAVLVGTRKWAHLGAALDALTRGPLPDDVHRVVEDRFAQVGAGWPAMI